ncbi:hypothetical protein JAAARDRAFT_51770 [Jaapia argillacea MUCL 33604]|uniref:Uncharacterized protein n=1 Tax=Jaapia argillacea MUCL 33604 TaxID=933084 RepID=A0A067P6A4_9AGAM|nr:hypothetical protein JAAARDRAFT_51770 [Jaapia argillacea MUCL 33604]
MCLDVAIETIVYPPSLNPQSQSLSEDEEEIVDKALQSGMSHVVYKGHGLPGLSAFQTLLSGVQSSKSFLEFGDDGLSGNGEHIQPTSQEALDSPSQDLSLYQSPNKCRTDALHYPRKLLVLTRMETGPTRDAEEQDSSNFTHRLYSDEKVIRFSTYGEVDPGPADYGHGAVLPMTKDESGWWTYAAPSHNISPTTNHQSYPTPHSGMFNETLSIPGSSSSLLHTHDGCDPAGCDQSTDNNRRLVSQEPSDSSHGAVINHPFGIQVLSTGVDGGTAVTEEGVAVKHPLLLLEDGVLGEGGPSLSRDAASQPVPTRRIGVMGKPLLERHRNAVSASSSNISESPYPKALLAPESSPGSGRLASSKLPVRSDRLRHRVPTPPWFSGDSLRPVSAEFSAPEIENSVPDQQAVSNGRFGAGETPCIHPTYPLIQSTTPMARPKPSANYTTSTFPLERFACISNSHSTILSSTQEADELPLHVTADRTVGVNLLNMTEQVDANEGTSALTALPPQALVLFDSTVHGSDSRLNHSLSMQATELVPLHTTDTFASSLPGPTSHVSLDICEGSSYLLQRELLNTQVGNQLPVLPTELIHPSPTGVVSVSPETWLAPKTVINDFLDSRSTGSLRPQVMDPGWSHLADPTHPSIVDAVPPASSSDLLDLHGSSNSPDSRSIGSLRTQGRAGVAASSHLPVEGDTHVDRDIAKESSSLERILRSEPHEKVVLVRPTLRRHHATSGKLPKLASLYKRSNTSFLRQNLLSKLKKGKAGPISSHHGQEPNEPHAPGSSTELQEPRPSVHNRSPLFLTLMERQMMPDMIPGQMMPSSDDDPNNYKGRHTRFSLSEFHLSDPTGPGLVPTPITDWAFGSPTSAKESSRGVFHGSLPLAATRLPSAPSSPTQNQANSLALGSNPGSGGPPITDWNPTDNDSEESQWLRTSHSLDPKGKGRDMSDVSEARIPDSSNLHDPRHPNPSALAFARTTSYHPSSMVDSFVSQEHPESLTSVADTTPKMLKTTSYHPSGMVDSFVSQECPGGLTFVADTTPETFKSAPSTFSQERPATSTSAASSRPEQSTPVQQLPTPPSDSDMDVDPPSQHDVPPTNGLPLDLARRLHRSLADITETLHKYMLPDPPKKPSPQQISEDDNVDESPRQIPKSRRSPGRKPLAVNEANAAVRKFLHAKSVLAVDLKLRWEDPLSSIWNMEVIWLLAGALHDEIKGGHYEVLKHQGWLEKKRAEVAKILRECLDRAKCSQSTLRSTVPPSLSSASPDSSSSPASDPTSSTSNSTSSANNPSPSTSNPMPSTSNSTPSTSDPTLSPSNPASSTPDPASSPSATDPVTSSSSRAAEARRNRRTSRRHSVYTRHTKKARLLASRGPEYKKSENALKRVGAGGTSDDETDDGLIPKSVRRVDLEWRAPGLGLMMRAIDSDNSHQWPSRRGNRSLPREPQARRAERGRVVHGLPTNWYSETWLASLSQSERDSLEMTPEEPIPVLILIMFASPLLNEGRSQGDSTRPCIFKQCSISMAT